jgi:hypothetical protein
MNFAHTARTQAAIDHPVRDASLLKNGDLGGRRISWLFFKARATSMSGDPPTRWQ